MNKTFDTAVNIFSGVVYAMATLALPTLIPAGAFILHHANQPNPAYRQSPSYHAGQPQSTYRAFFEE